MIAFLFQVFKSFIHRFNCWMAHLEMSPSSDPMRHLDSAGQLSAYIAFKGTLFPK